MKYFKDPVSQEVYGYDPVTQQDLIDIAIASGFQDVSNSWPPAPPSDLLKLQCKDQARQKLVDTDFSQAIDVAAILLNKADYDAYRSTVRDLYLYPVDDPQWPDLPVAIWK